MILKNGGRDGEEVDASGEIKLDDDKLGDIVKAIGDIKKKSPDLLKDNQPVAEFLKLLYIRCKIKPTVSKPYLPKLEEDGLLILDGDKVTVL